MLKSSGYFEIANLILVAFSCLFIAYSTWCGLGFTYDSFDYFAASRSWRQTNELLNENGSLYIFHAPLFPIFLSIFNNTSLSNFFLVIIAIGALNMVLLKFIYQKYFAHSYVFMLCHASIILSVGFQMIHHFLWTESIFMLMFLIHNFFMLKFLETHKRQDLWILTFMAFMMGITKNTGFFIILIASLIILLHTKKQGFKAAAFYGLLGSTGFVFWNLLVVYQRGGSSMYIESGFLSGFWVNLYNYSDVISQWFMPATIPLFLRLFILGLIFFALGYLALKDQSNFQIRSLLLLFFLYLLIMIFFIEVHKDEIERLLSIVAPWLMIAIFLTLDRHWSSLTKTIRIAVVLVVVLFVSYTAIRSFRNVDSWHHRSCSEETVAFFQFILP